MLRKKGAVPRLSSRVDNNSCLRKIKNPKWYDKECSHLHKQLKHTAKLLTSYPNNSWLKGKLISENKQYKKVLRVKQKHYMENIFSQLEGMHGTDPKKYMDLVRSLRNGQFDKQKPSDTSEVSP